MISEYYQRLVKATSFERQYRVRIGPRKGSVLARLYQLGQPVSLPDNTYELAQDYEADSEVILRTSMGFPEKGGFIISPYSTAGIFTYNGISPNALLNVSHVQGSTRHLAGSLVVLFIDITDRVTSKPIISQQVDGHVADWSAKISGEKYDHVIMFPDCSITIEEKFALDDESRSEWLLAAHGYVPQWQVEGDAGGLRKWSATINSERYYLRSCKIKAVRYGVNELQSSVSVTASGTLASAYLEPAEFLLGVSEPIPSAVVDGNNDTAWISDEAP